MVTPLLPRRGESQELPLSEVKKMEGEQVRQIQVQEETQEPATIRQVHYIEVLATKLGFQCNTSHMTKEEAARKIELLKAIMHLDSHHKNKEKDIKLAMAKKLIYRKWIEKHQEINKQTEKRFMEEVAYLNTVFERIDQAILSEQAG